MRKRNDKNNKRKRKTLGNSCEMKRHDEEDGA